jgi:tetratricopeptide (TPR) repeat protein
MLVNEVLLPKQQYQQAVSAALRVRDVDARELLVRYARARKAMDAGKYEEAEKELQWVALVGLVPPSVSIAAGSLHEKKGRYFEAAKYYYRAKRTRRESGIGKASEALQRVQLRYQDRLSDLRRRLAVRPDDIDVLGELANLEMELYFLDEAEARYRTILAIRPDLAAARYNLGLTHARQGRNREAASEILAAIEGGLELAHAWNNLGIAYKEMAEIESAIHAFKRAYELDPGHWFAVINLSRMYRALGKKDLARETLMKARAQAAEGSGFADLVDIYLRSMEPS